MMDADMLPYDSRPMASGPLQRPAMVPQFFGSSPYSAAPVPSTPAPHYQTPVSYGGYSPYNSPPISVVSPVSQSCEVSEVRPVLSMLPPDANLNRGLAYPRETSAQVVDATRSPSVKCETAPYGIIPGIPNMSSRHRTVSPIAPLNPADTVSFNTEVDELVKTLQSKKDTDVIVKNAETVQQLENEIKMEPISQDQDDLSGSDRPGTGMTTSTPHSGKARMRKYPCDIPNCGKNFYQKTHLDIHRRSHTGEKPYVCKRPGCQSRFSQLGNLRTHERRHTGEKPFQCTKCGKRFAQRGNVREHQKIHMNTKPYHCRLDDCRKSFTQLGNLKAHQNRFHVETIKQLTAKFGSIKDFEKASKSDRDLWEYFATLYKNSNKGIKGRGKDRRVGPPNERWAPSATPPACAAPTASTTPPTASSGAERSRYNVPPLLPARLERHPLPTEPQRHSLPPYPLQHPLQHTLDSHGLSHPATFSIGRQNMLVGVYHRDQPTGHNYEIFDVEDESVAGSGPPSATNAVPPSYEEEQSRELAFGDRYYR